MAGSPKAPALPADTEAVLIDAYGTLVGLDPPVPALRAGLAAAGHHHDEATVAAAFAAEVAHYRAHHLRAGTRRGLAAVRLECAAVMAGHLGADAPSPAAMADILLAGLRFRLFPDALPALDALRARGLRLAVVSNWDMALADVLADLGIAGRFEAITISAVCGVAKPDPAIYALTLDALGVDVARSVHVGDDPVLDGEGARAAGLRAVLIDRARDGSDERTSRVAGGITRISQLTELVDPPVRAGTSPHNTGRVSRM